MRKAFDANVPKLKPRLGRSASLPFGEEAAAPGAQAAEPMEALPDPAPPESDRFPDGESEAVSALEGGEPIAAADPTPEPPHPDPLPRLAPGARGDSHAAPPGTRDSHAAAPTFAAAEAARPEPLPGSAPVRVRSNGAAATTPGARQVSRSATATMAAREGSRVTTATRAAPAAREAFRADANFGGEPSSPGPAFSPSPPAPAEGTPDPATSDVLARKARLDKIKRRVAEAARPQPRLPSVPADAAGAKESVLALVRELEAELTRAREREDALRGDLDEARGELARVAGEGRSAVERLAAAEKELDEKRGVLGELLGEMQALEEERDASVRRAQALSTLDEERAKLLEDLGRRGDEEARLRAEREAEVDRLSEELRLAGADGARLRAAVGELARERDQLGADLDRARRERDDLAEAKRALEAVHAALAQARARLG